MNIYIATKGNMVGAVLTGEDNRASSPMVFKTQTTDYETQVIWACRRAIHHVEINKPVDVSDTINIYSERQIDVAKLQNDEYIKRHQFNFVQRQIETDQEKNRMLSAKVAIDMDARRQLIRGGYSR